MVESVKNHQLNKSKIHMESVGSFLSGCWHMGVS